MLIDQAKIYVQGGHGGDGCNSVYKDIFNRKGVPDGGDGGHGGNVYFVSDSNLHTLLDFKYRQHYNAGKGAHGGSNNKQGARGKDMFVRVPIGTIIKDNATGLVIKDLSAEGDKVVVAGGGDGGKGSARKKEVTLGDSGEEKTLLLELKLVADAGIIGFPNAGKSTLISRISKVHSKIAPYPFTTKSPKLGVVYYNDNDFVVADMPGLIEGAHEGKGLGDRFLKHIERTFVLVHLVDIAPVDGTDPVDNYLKLEEELKLYSDDVYNKPRIIAASKMDLTDADDALRRIRDAAGQEVYPISSVTGEGIDSLVGTIYKRISDVKDKKGDDQDRDESLDWLTE